MQGTFISKKTFVRAIAKTFKRLRALDICLVDITEVAKSFLKYLVNVHFGSVK